MAQQSAPQTNTPPLHCSMTARPRTLLHSSLNQHSRRQAATQPASQPASTSGARARVSVCLPACLPGCETHVCKSIASRRPCSSRRRTLPRHITPPSRHTHNHDHDHDHTQPACLSATHPCMPPSLSTPKTIQPHSLIARKRAHTCGCTVLAAAAATAAATATHHGKSSGRTRSRRSPGRTLHQRTAHNRSTRASPNSRRRRRRRRRHRQITHTRTHARTLARTRTSARGLTHGLRVGARSTHCTCTQIQMHHCHHACSSRRAAHPIQSNPIKLTCASRATRQHRIGAGRAH